MGNRREYLINSIVEICHKLDKKGFGANHDGNVSVRFEDKLLATPTAQSKGDIVPEMILTLDMQGNKIQGIGKPFSEIKLHLAAYQAREDISAVVHSHPPFSMARGLVGGDFQVSVPEAIVSIGDVIPVAKYVIPGDNQHETIITQLLSQHDLFMMAGNGVLSIGKNLKEAYFRTELLEHLLKIEFYASTMGELMSIPEEDKRQLLEKRAQIGLGPKYTEPSPIDIKQDKQENKNDLLKDLITQEIKKVLKEK